MTELPGLTGLEGADPEFCFVVRLYESEENSLVVVVRGSHLTGEKYDDPSALIDAERLESSPSDPAVELRWNSYILYAVRNESYTALDEYEVVSNRKAVLRVSTRSRFLDYLKNSTFADESYPGRFVHYQLCTSNHIIDVASQEPPEVAAVLVQDAMKSRTRHFLAD